MALSLSVVLIFLEFFFALGQSTCVNSAANELPMVTACFAQSQKTTLCGIKRRRTAVLDVGYPNYFHGWADVQGQGAANDYCRFVGYPHELQFSCALAGNYLTSDDRNYNSTLHFPTGIDNTWYMKDEDGDGRDDYCRCMEYKGHFAVVCTKSGQFGFYGSPEQGGEMLTFVVGSDVEDCSTRVVRPEFGRKSRHDSQS